ncbi:DUF2537 domain-containing protein [Tsukamurella paurometabola]|uniref:Uncharacterized protein n=1 Tax=Tsukamurella paurometabola (strain ATCC 8368 / DSM 20162 / CCUG 35730 / CIP 100753 / JCM 10117 / KCTC 9821 / NBRC 16120 / NCIMB 702349 / NCTC 13040) TaxID=521096 RepID=D5UTW8_TSUPD|nr:DUF2537 domain-containing protein [Tsukamurella paurometabola]ADG77472.1 conserved hypothetical protein [Tsukamurella paurometabola DSM 20162]SUP27277.1 Protein of uncharacterised function (DUF2537) [Tsukamurella paurometabola]
MRFTVWYTGAAVAVLVALLGGPVLSALFLAVMLVNVWLGVALLALGTAGAAPVLYLYRRTPVARWFCAGGLLAVLVVWIAAGAAIANGVVG